MFILRLFIASHIHSVALSICEIAPKGDDFSFDLTFISRSILIKLSHSSDLIYDQLMSMWHCGINSSVMYGDNLLVYLFCHLTI